MKWRVIFIVALISVVILFQFLIKRNADLDYLLITENNMELKSNSFKHNSIIPPEYTCDSENINPNLSIEGVSEDTKELVLIVDDPDAPAGTWMHWTMWGISPSINVIDKGKLPEGVKEGLTSFGTVGYGGPCPPVGTGTHRYSFRIYALNKNINLNAGATPEELEREMSDSVIDSAEIIGLYSHDK